MSTHQVFYILYFLLI